MGVPHYSRVIRGKAVEQGPEYGDRTRMGEGSGTAGDETEDLTELLREVMVSESSGGSGGGGESGTLIAREEGNPGGQWTPREDQSL
jgi:hypothetical protein